MAEALAQVSAGLGPGTAVHARRADDHGGPDPVPGRHRVDVGLHPCPPGDGRRRRRRGHPRGVGPRRLERFADRMQARFERLAPGFGSCVLERRILGPAELESRDANLIGGAINGGTSQLHQELVFRPVPGWAGPRPGTRALPRVRLRPPRRRRPRSRRDERRPRGPRAPAPAARPALMDLQRGQRSPRCQRVPTSVDDRGPRVGEHEGLSGRGPLRGAGDRALGVQVLVGPGS